MILPDVNVLVYAYRRDAPDHARYLSWLRETAGSDELIGIPSTVIAGLIRITTHPTVFPRPSRLEEVLAFADELRALDTFSAVEPGSRHWPIFTDICRATNARGNLITDAYLAALAIENGADFITTDRDFARFPGLRWRHPLQG